MKKLFKNYKISFLLLLSIIIGTIFGLIFKEKTEIIKPLGDLFLNLLLCIIIPLLFLTIATSIGKIYKPKRLGKILLSIVLVFIVTSIISSFIGIFVTKSFKLVSINGIITNNNYINDKEEINVLQRTIETISVNDFNKLLTKENMIALIAFSILTGLAINKAKEKGKKFLELLESASEVVNKLIEIIMYYAPIGLGCYFAYLTGTFGGDLAKGYLKTFVIYAITAILFYIIIYSLYALIANGKKGLKCYWKHVLPASVTALATCSSAATIPVNLVNTKKMGVPDDIANTTIPLGTSFHKDGSVIGSVFKIMFLVYLFNTSISIHELVLISLLATLLVSAIPVGGGTISELLIITILGFPIAALPLLTAIATIIDPPATLLNVVGDSAASMLITKVVDGKKAFN